MPTYEELIQENARLRNENAELRRRLAYYEPPIQAQPKSHFIELSLEEKVNLFKRVFRPREDVFARRWYSSKTDKSGYQPVCINEWNHLLCNKTKYKCADCPNRQFKSLEYQDIYNHLAGKYLNGNDVIGTYAIHADNTCYFLCADFDDKNTTHGYKDDVLAFIQVCRNWNIPYAIERSRSGNGAHVWIFFESATEPYKARKLGFTILTEAMNLNGRMSLKSYDRFLPNQDKLPEGGLGNLIALPLQGLARKKGNSVFVDDDFNVIPDQWAFLQSIRKLSDNQLTVLLAKHSQQSDLGELSTTTESKPWEVPNQPKFTWKNPPRVLSITYANQLYIPLKELPNPIINHFKRLAAFLNPEFYKKQAMRLSTYSTPRIISCAQIVDDYLVLPRGCIEEVQQVLQTHAIDVHIDDKSNHGRPIKTEFNGELRKEQQEAIRLLTKQNIGVLQATPAFGKTVTAIGLIATYRVNTLILVHTKALLDQWQKRLETFLSIPHSQQIATKGKRARSPIGILDSQKNTLAGFIDVALMQSCLKEGEGKEFLRDYGLVIVDECHHVPSITFELIMKSIHARYVYGLTATPIRKDGHQPIIFMQCGKIRYSSNDNQPRDGQLFQRFLIPRFTTYKEVVNNDLSLTKQMSLLLEDELRNMLIVNDICEALDNHRTPIVLTNRRAHISLIADALTKRGRKVITLIGSESPKTKRNKMLELEGLSKEDSFVIIATGKYIGEGFDFPRLDTLFLTMPVSWKGLIEQYAGRLHREYPNKQDVRIYDYIDVHIPICNVMYQRRIKGYIANGYQIYSPTPFEGEYLPATSPIYNGQNYMQHFLQSIQSARKSIVISAFNIRVHPTSCIVSILQRLLTNGVHVTIVVKHHNKQDILSALGIQVITKEDLTIQTVIIDKKHIWFGTINYLGTNAPDNYAIQLSDLKLAEGLLNLLFDE